ncbi:MAG TPA: hypothetical protein VK158_04240 [Acidobacteriota bacterium]|nr:hypothetical protein [Acidobacteriota bacterium]
MSRSSFSRFDLKKYIVIISLFLVALVVSMPLTSAASIASVATISNTDVYNYAKPSDSILRVINVSAPGATPADIVPRLFIGNIAIQSCEATEELDILRCTLARTLTAADTGIKQYEAVLYTDSTKSAIEDRRTGTFVIDSVPPSVVVGTIRQNGPNLTIPITVTDTALSAVNGNRCSGVRKVEVFYNGTSTNIASNLSMPVSCSFSQTFEVEAPALPSGIKQICAKATDRVGLSAQHCNVVTIDKTPPTLVANSLVVRTDSIPKVVSVPAGSGLNAFVEARFSNDYVPSSVVFKVNGEEVERASCSGVQCRSQQITLSESASLSLSVSFADAQGNVGTASATQSIQVDDAGPVIKSFSTGKTLGTKPLIGSRGTVDVLFTESGSGLFRKQAVLSIDGSTFGNPICVASSSTEWKCSWNVTLSGADGERTISVTGSDDVGNSIRGDAATIVFDGTAPRYVLPVSVSAISTVPLSTPISASKMVLNISINDSSAVTYAADFKDFDTGVVSGTCSALNCIITSGNIGSGPYNFPVTVNLTDAAGNTVSVVTQRIQTLKTVVDTNTSYFNHQVKLTPAGIEGTTSKYLNQRAYAIVTIVPKTGAKVLSATLDSCYGIGASATSARVAGDTKFLQNFSQQRSVNSSVVVLDFTTKAAELTQPNIVFLCNINVAGQVENTYVSKEVETILVNFSVYNLSMGSVGDSYKQELDAALADAKNMKYLDKFRKLYDLARKICTLYSAIMSIMQIWTLMTALMDSTGEKLTAAVYTAPAGIAMKLSALKLCLAADKSSDAVKIPLKGVFKGFCQFINCQWSLTGAIYGSLANGESFGAAGQNSVQNRVGNAVTGIAGARPNSLLAGNGTGSIIGFDKINTDDSLVWSTLNLCIPGILKNLDKQRQIKCRYAKCVRDDVPNGIPLTACKEAKAYAECQYLYGQFFSSIPVLSVYNYFINQFKSLVSDPLAIAGFALTLGLCIGPCVAGYSPAKFGCAALRLTQEVFGMVANIMAIRDVFDDDQMMNVNYCEGL